MFFDSSKLSIERLLHPHPHPHPKNVQQTFVLHTQNSKSFVLHTQKKETKKHTKNAHCHIHNTHADQKKNFLEHMPEPVLLLS
jgi:hypothetical protein